MNFETWSILAGILLLAMAASSFYLKRMPLTTTLFYLAIGLVIGPLGFELFYIAPLENIIILERVAEIIVIISLFNSGLKMRLDLSDKSWWLPIRLAFLSMVITVFLIAAAGYFFLSLPIGAAILLGAILSPTDPVLASEVQLDKPREVHRLKFMLTGEAGFNDGTVFPFIMLGLGLLGLHEIGSFGLRWFLIDVLWAIIGGLGFGALAAYLNGKLLAKIRSKSKENKIKNEFITLGLIAFSYGGALLINTYGFLAVFAAGTTVRIMEKKQSEKLSEKGKNDEQVTDSILGFNEQLENIFEIVIVVLIGAMISYTYLPNEAIWFIPLLFFIVRPAAVFLGLIGSPAETSERNLAAWFGIRGVGSIYYLMYTIKAGLPEDISIQLINFTLIVIAVSILIHGITVSPLLKKFG